MNTVAPRLISGVFAGITGLAVLEMLRLKGATLVQQPSLATVLAACGVMGTLVGIVGCLMPRRYWKILLSNGQQIYSALALPRPMVNHWAGSLLLSGSLVVYFIVLMNILPQQPPPDNNDQASFLMQAKTVHEAGGPVTLAQQLLAGEYSEANQHPLYVALLSYFPNYETGKRLSAMFGLCALLIFTMGIARYYGNLVGGLTGILLSINAAYCQLTARVVCEGLLLIFVAGLWLMVLRIPDSRKPSRLPSLLLIGIGLMLGLAWLTKGTALLLMLGLVLWLCSYTVNWNRWISAILQRQPTDDSMTGENQTKQTTVPLKRVVIGVALVIGSFTVIAAPLLIRNVRVYGSPTFNANSYLLFEDEFSEPHALIKERGSLRNAAQNYWQSHTISEMIKREVKGLLWQIFIFLRSLGPLPFGEGRLFFGLLALPFLIVGLMSESGPSRRLYLIWMLLFCLAFAWYLPIAAGERFLTPLLLPSLAFVSLGLVRTGQLLLARRSEMPLSH
ncbi:hypothetical protein [Gimesia maris]|uniref:hypothetical protein n=1 Tax=Gimesia maris TaxID=122 RepID=UPI00241F2795|nr:hypothetical protein [Gimesia maris]|tara:strand:+ start:29639 stop:31150 length:1512 start_codon:yes stop_codon:yes gene_type:complete